MEEKEGKKKKEERRRGVKRKGAKSKVMQE